MGNSKSVNRNSDKTVTNLDLTTKDNVTRDSFQEHIKRFGSILASSVSNTNRKRKRETEVRMIERRRQQ